MIPKHNAQDIDKCIGKYICRAPDREGGGGRRKRQTMNRKMNMKTRVMQVISIFAKNRQ